MNRSSTIASDQAILPAFSAAAPIKTMLPARSSARRVPFQLDGDYAGRLPLSIETNPRSGRLLMPVESRLAK